MRPLGSTRLAGRMEQLTALDGIAGSLQAAVRKAVPQESQLKDLLSGTWFGHPVHPPLTDVVIGTWTGALVLDLLGGDGAEQAADCLVATGIAAAVPTAATGLSDWAELRDGSRRVGTVHAIGNATGLALQALSWAARRSDHRRLGIALSALGYSITGLSAWLGGHLVLSHGVGVNRVAFEAPPSEWTPVYDDADLGERTLTAAQANSAAVLLVRADGEVYALADTCTHRGCALHEGELDGDTVVCPCHGSTFRLDGSIVKGPATALQPRYQVRIRAGKVEIQD
jgi:nitrite reductase/ring-hydroxylating ferredoxin subunit/uncharacterized membrane protein